MDSVTGWKVHPVNLLRFGQMGYRLYIMHQRFGSDGYDIVQTLTMKSVPSNQFVDDGDYAMTDEVPSADVRGFLQAMSDAAWEVGIKPKQLEDNRNELKAVRDHLSDMRKLAKVSE